MTGFCSSDIKLLGPVQLIGEFEFPDIVTLSIAQYQLQGASYLNRT